jgi:hypothetical protein
VKSKKNLGFGNFGGSVIYHGNFRELTQAKLAEKLKFTDLQYIIIFCLLKTVPEGTKKAKLETASEHLRIASRNGVIS